MTADTRPPCPIWDSTPARTAHIRAQLGIDFERTPFAGTVIQDRWGLRWRADLTAPAAEEGWVCKSAGLRVWLTDEEMADRGPLLVVRTDRVFSGEAAMRDRWAGEAADAAQTFRLHEDPA